jgi:hypothetical protein
VTCTTNFLADDGTPLPVPFGGAAASATRTDMLVAGASIHLLSTAGATATGGWAKAQCSGPVKASMLFRWYNQGEAITEAGVNASTTPTTKFATYAQTLAGVAFANPSTTQAVVTIVVLDATGTVLNTSTVMLPPQGHQSYNIYNWVSQNFSGSVQIASTVPIVSLSLNAEASTPADLVVSSLPPGDL